MKKEIKPLSEKAFWEDEEWRKKEIKKMEKNKKASEKRTAESGIRKFEEYLKSGSRTY